MFIIDAHFTKKAVKQGWKVFSCNVPNGKNIDKNYNYGDFNDFVFSKHNPETVNINYRSNPDDSYYQDTIMKYSKSFVLYIPNKTYIVWDNPPKGFLGHFYLRRGYKIICSGAPAWYDAVGRAMDNWKALAENNIYGVDYHFEYDVDAFDEKVEQKGCVDLTTLKDGDEVVCINVPGKLNESYEPSFIQNKKYKIRKGKHESNKLFIADERDKGFYLDRQQFKECFMLANDFTESPIIEKPKKQRRTVQVVKLNNIDIKLYNVDEKLFRKLLSI